MIEQLVNWHVQKHPGFTKENDANTLSRNELTKLYEQVIKPISHNLGGVKITYGFTGHSLLCHILKHSPGDMAPSIDQHAAMELNSKGNRICKRDGASCDFYVESYEQRMDEVAKYICQYLEFDRLYFYGKDRPIHISVGPENSRYALIRETRSDGLRVNKKSAKGSEAIHLFDNL